MEVVRVAAVQLCSLRRKILQNVVCIYYKTRGADKHSLWSFPNIMLVYVRTSDQRVDESCQGKKENHIYVIVDALNAMMMVLIKVAFVCRDGSIRAA